MKALKYLLLTIFLIVNLCMHGDEPHNGSIKNILFKGYAVFENKPLVCIAICCNGCIGKLSWYSVGEMIERNEIIGFNKETETLILKNERGEIVSIVISEKANKENNGLGTVDLGKQYFEKILFEILGDSSVDETSYKIRINDDIELQKHPKDVESIANVKRTKEPLGKRVTYAYVRGILITVVMKNYGPDDLPADTAKGLTAEDYSYYNEKIGKAAIIRAARQFIK